MAMIISRPARWRVCRDSVTTQFVVAMAFELEIELPIARSQDELHIGGARPYGAGESPL